LIEASAAKSGPTPTPSLGTRVLTEARVRRWRRVLESEATEPSDWTKLGGIPFWIQAPEYRLLKRGWKYIGQLGGPYRFDGEVPSPNKVGGKVGVYTNGKLVYRNPTKTRPGAPPWVAQHQSGEGWFCMGPMFGDAGIGYLLERRSKKSLEFCFLWQCG
jgi:hypothetical protein